MQNLDVAVALVAAVVVVILFILRRPGGRTSPMHGLAAGAVVGLVAAVLVLVLGSDLIPDETESVLRPLFFAVVALIIAGGVLTRFARR